MSAPETNTFVGRARRAICVAHGFPRPDAQGWLKILAILASMKLGNLSPGCSLDRKGTLHALRRALKSGSQILPLDRHTPEACASEYLRVSSVRCCVGVRS
jgi:hypothetical protein